MTLQSSSQDKRHIALEMSLWCLLSPGPYCSRGQYNLGKKPNKHTSPVNTFWSACDKPEWQQHTRNVKVPFTFEHQILESVQVNWSAERVIFNFYRLLICTTIFTTLIETEMMFVMPVHVISKLEHNSDFLSGFCGFLGFTDFVLSSFYAFC